MGARRVTERLEKPTTTVLPSTIKFSRLSLHRLYAKCRAAGIASWNDGMDYADFIHALWNTMLTNDDFKDEAQKIEEALGQGDAIQLLSDVFIDSRKETLE